MEDKDLLALPDRNRSRLPTGASFLRSSSVNFWKRLGALSWETLDSFTSMWTCRAPPMDHGKLDPAWFSFHGDKNICVSILAGSMLAVTLTNVRLSQCIEAQPASERRLSRCQGLAELDGICRIKQTSPVSCHQLA